MRNGKLISGEIGYSQETLLAKTYERWKEQIAIFTYTIENLKSIPLTINLFPLKMNISFLKEGL